MSTGTRSTWSTPTGTWYVTRTSPVHTAPGKAIPAPVPRPTAVTTAAHTASGRTIRADRRPHHQRAPPGIGTRDTRGAPGPPPVATEAPRVPRAGMVRGGRLRALR